jgi:uncharacterized membrane protein
VLGAVAFYEIVIALHIIAVVIAFGATFAYPVILGAVVRTDPRALPAAYSAIHAISRRIINPGLAAILIFGIYLASKLHLWHAFFVQWGLGVVVVLGALEGAYIGPREKRLVAVAQADIASAGPDGEVVQSAEHRALSRSVGAVGALMDLLVVVTIFFMVARTGA